MCTENAAPMNRGITHHCRLQHVSTAQYTLLTRSDIVRMSQPGLNVSEWLSSPSPSLPLLPRLCLRLFSSAVFSLHVSPPLPLSPPHAPFPPIPSSVADCSHDCVMQSRSGRVVTTPRTGAGSFYHETRRTTAKQLFFTSLSYPPIPLLPATCRHSGICSAVLHLFHHSTRRFRPGDKHRLLARYLCCHLQTCYFRGC